jgi:hypothetical protein
VAEAWYKEEILAMFCWITILPVQVTGAFAAIKQHPQT